MKRILMVGGGLVVVVLVAVLVWFQPQKLVMDDRIDEEVPGVGAAATDDSEDDTQPVETPGVEPAEQSGPQELATGSFTNLAHEVTGRALILETADGSLYLRFEDFEVENGPDLRVYLSDDSDGSYDSTFIDLGALKGNIGNQNYEIPSDTDLSAYDNAVIWCRRFSVGFAVAELR